MHHLTLKRILAVGCLSASLSIPLSQVQATDLNFTPDFRLDQQSPKAAFGSNGGVVVWQDLQSTNGKFTLKGLKLNSNLVVENSIFYINDENSQGYQENIHIAPLHDGGFAYVWQGGEDAHQKIYLRIQKSDGLFSSTPLEVTQLQGYHSQPSVAATAEKILVVWQSFNGTSDTVHDVYGKFYSLDGDTLSPSFLLSKKISGNQKSPIVTADGDSFGVFWIDDYQNPVRVKVDSANHLVRLVGKRIRSVPDATAPDNYLSDPNVILANPAVNNLTNGDFVIVASGRVSGATDDGWDIYRLQISPNFSTNSETIVNKVTYGDQIAPSIAQTTQSEIIVWNALGMDGSGFGIYRRATNDPQEYLVNSTTNGHQMNAFTTAINDNSYLTLWSGFNSVAYGFDIFGKVINPVIDTAAPPVVYGYSSSSNDISVNLSYPIDRRPTQFEFQVTQGDVHQIHGSNTSQFKLSGLPPSSTVSVRARYTAENGTVSDWSDSVTITTWGVDSNFDGLPDNWQLQFFGPSFSQYPKNRIWAYGDFDQDGASNISEFLAGTNPADGNSLLKVSISIANDSFLVSWNSVPGGLYILEGSSNLSSWSRFGSPRLATDAYDSATINDLTTATYFRVVKIN